MGRVSQRVGELTFKGDALQWIGDILKEEALPFSAVKQELPSPRPGQHPQQHDLVLLDDKGKPALTGELRLPDRHDGRHPYLPALVRDAQDKANRAGVKWFITWNVNTLVLWETFQPHVPILDRNFQEFPVAAIQDSAELEKPDVQAQIKERLRSFLLEFALVYSGKGAVARKPPDEAFIRILNLHLHGLIQTVTQGLLHEYQQKPSFSQKLRDWYVKEQGWSFEGSPRRLPDEIERAARLGTYILVNKLVFYEALQRRFPSLNPLRLSGNTAAAVKREVRAYFRDAIAKSQDYETVFDWGFADEIPFVSDAAAPLWADLVENLAQFDFTRLSYDVIGLLFSRLIDPEEKHQYGQYYTPPDVVDLINAFCIRRPEAVVLDPACGGGTFLVRAYARKKAMYHGLSHRQRLSQLWGVDVASFPVSLAVINLATRDLVEEENYPRIAHRDFFTVFRGLGILGLPVRTEAKLDTAGVGAAKTQFPLPDVDAVVGNLPYVRQEDIEDKGKLVEALGKDFGTSAPRLSGRSDFHVYFWPHVTPFLYEGGYLGFLTSNSWLDVDYGKDLQKFILDHYRIVAIIESKVERWFPEAAVNTCITILQKCSSARERENNLVRFVHIKKPLSQLIPPTENEVVRQQTVDHIRDFIESATYPIETDSWRIWPVKQQELYREGLDDTGAYQGAKWGKSLRAPRVFFEILERGKDKLVRLGDIAEVRRGFTTGANEFFYLTEEQAREWGIEPEYLKPVVKSPREIEGIVVDPAKLRYRVLMVHQDKTALKGKRVLKYINWGERQGYHQRPTCASRERWYDLGRGIKGPIVWPMVHNDRTVAALNPDSILLDHNLFEITPFEPLHSAILCAFLNSTVTTLLREFMGRANLGEGALKTEGIDIRKLLVFPPSRMRHNLSEGLLSKLRLLKNRANTSIFDEVHQPDRQALDALVLEALGFTNPEERARVQRELYEAVTDLVQSRLERARSVDGLEAGERLNPQAVAQELIRELDNDLLRDFPADFLPAEVDTETLEVPEGDIEVGIDLFSAGSIRVGTRLLQVGSLPRAQFIRHAIEAGARNTVDVPLDEQICAQAVLGYQEYRQRLGKTLEELALTRSNSKKTVARIRDELERLVFAPGE